MAEFKLANSEPIEAYFELAEYQPRLFAQSERVPLIMDKEKMRAFSEEKALPMGVVFNNEPYYYVVADLCGKYDRLFRYSRVIYCNFDSNGVVALPTCGGKFGLVTHYRHAPRMESLEFPRGFSEKEGLTPAETVREELSEELGVGPDQCSVRLLGAVRADGGLSAGVAQVFCAEISEEASIRICREEGISRFQWVDESQLLDMIREGMISDGFTLSAYTLYHSHLTQPWKK